MIKLIIEYVQILFQRLLNRERTFLLLCESDPEYPVRLRSFKIQVYGCTLSIKDAIEYTRELDGMHPLGPKNIRIIKIVEIPNGRFFDPKEIFNKEVQK